MHKLASLGILIWHKKFELVIWLFRVELRCVLWRIHNCSIDPFLLNLVLYLSIAIFEKLEYGNYMLLFKRVESVIKAHKLHHFMVNPIIPTKFNSFTDATANRLSHEYVFRNNVIKSYWYDFNRHVYACNWFETLVYALE